MLKMYYIKNIYFLKENYFFYIRNYDNSPEKNIQAVQFLNTMIFDLYDFTTSTMSLTKFIKLNSKKLQIFQKLVDGFGCPPKLKLKLNTPIFGFNMSVNVLNIQLSLK